jgi:uncharacterized protein (DUF433 family)
MFTGAATRTPPGSNLAGCGGREIANLVENCLSGGLPVSFWRTLNEGDRTMASLDWSQCSAVESIPGKVSGAWVLKGTRMPVSAIFENLEAGANIDDIMEWFDGLDREQVKAVIEFAVRSLDKEPVYAP